MKLVKAGRLLDDQMNSRYSRRTERPPALVRAIPPGRVIDEPRPRALACSEVSGAPTRGGVWGTATYAVAPRSSSTPKQ